MKSRQKRQTHLAHRLQPVEPARNRALDRLGNSSPSGYLLTPHLRSFPFTGDILTSDLVFPRPFPLGGLALSPLVAHTGRIERLVGPRRAALCVLLLVLPASCRGLLHIGIAMNAVFRLVDHMALTRRGLVGRLGGVEYRRKVQRSREQRVGTTRRRLCECTESLS